MKVPLSSFLQEVSDKTTINDQYPVLTSSKAGLFLQSDYFNKQVASRENIGYKIIRRGQFTYRAMSDTGEFFPNMLECADIGIVSPAYPVFEITKPDLVLSDYLKFFFKSDVFQHSISAFAQGSTRTSVKFSKMQTVMISLPSIDEQRKIVEALKSVQKLVTTRETTLSTYDELIKARFVEMFGDPIHPIEHESLGEVATLERGRFSPRPRNDPRYYNGEYPFIQTGDIANCNHRLYSFRQTLNELGTRVSKRFDKGTIVIAIVGATIGATAILQRPVYAPDSVIGITPHTYNNVYLETLLQFWQPELQAIAPESARANINLSILDGIPVIKADLSHQQQFAAFVSQVDKSKVVVQKALDEAKLLFESLMQKYFG